MFSLIRVEDRSIGGFMALAWLAIVAALAGLSTPDLKRAGEAIAIAAAVALMLPGVASPVLSFIRNPRLGGGVHAQWKIAEGLRKAGIKPGDHIAVVGRSLGAYWARLAGVTIVAEICAERPSPPYLCQGGADGIREFWTAPPDVKQRVYEAFQKAGAKAVVATSLRGTELVAVDAVPIIGWRAILNTDYYVQVLGGIGDSSRPSAVSPRHMLPHAPPRR